MPILLQVDVSKHPMGMEVGATLSSAGLSLTLLIGATSLETCARTPVSSQGVPNQILTLIDVIGGNSTFPSITGAHGLAHSSAEARFRLQLNSVITFTISTYQTGATSISAPSWLEATYLSPMISLNNVLFVGKVFRA